MFRSASLFIGTSFTVAVFHCSKTCCVLKNWYWIYLKFSPKMAAQNFLEVFKTHDFLLLTIERLCRLLSRDDLAITSELQVAEAGMVWAQHDLPNRKCHVSRILGCVRMCHMTPRELLDLACLDECVMNNLEAKQAILMTNWWVHFLANTTKLMAYVAIF